MGSLIDRGDCPMRHGNGNCMPVGGFCTAVNDPICVGLRNAYEHGRSNALDQVIQLLNIPKPEGDLNG